MTTFGAAIFVTGCALLGIALGKIVVVTRETSTGGRFDWRAPWGAPPKNRRNR